MNTVLQPCGIVHPLDRVRNRLSADAELDFGEVEFYRVQELLAQLTEREREVLKGLVAGESNKVIALRLGISYRTVEKHRERIMEKMCVRSLASLVRTIILYRVGEATSIG